MRFFLKIIPQSTINNQRNEMELESKWYFVAMKKNNFIGIKEK